MNAFTLLSILGVIAMTSALECNFKGQKIKDGLHKCDADNVGVPGMPGKFLSKELGNLFPSLAETGNSSVTADKDYVCFRLQLEVKLKDKKQKEEFEKTCKGGKCVVKGCERHRIANVGLPLTEGCGSIEAKTKKPELDLKVSYCHCEKEKCNGALSNAAPSALLAVVGLFVAKFTVGAF